MKVAIEIKITEIFFPKEPLSETIASRASTFGAVCPSGFILSVY